MRRLKAVLKVGTVSLELYYITKGKLEIGSAIEFVPVSNPNTKPLTGIIDDASMNDMNGTFWFVCLM